MTQSFSLYLDLVRFGAAFAVLLSHLAFKPFTDKVVWWRLAYYGDTAVTVFFVLSGFVIAFVTTTREKTLADFFSARVARLYSVVVVALLLTFIFDALGSATNPDFYQAKLRNNRHPEWLGYASAFFFVNEFQIFNFGGISPGTNGPFWSLSFEAAYYAIAGVALFCKRVIWVPFAALVLVLGGQTIAVLFPLWLIGFFAYRIPLPKLSRPTSLVLAIICASAVLATPYLQISADELSKYFPWGKGPFSRNVLQDYFVSFFFVLHIWFVRSILNSSIELSFKTISIIRKLGLLSFPLYCTHYPAMGLLAAVSVWPISSVANAVWIGAMSLMLAYAVTPFTENVKSGLKKIINNRN